MATQTKTQDLFDLEGAVERWTEATRKAGNDYLDAYGKTVDQLADYGVKAAAATKLPVVTELAAVPGQAVAQPGRDLHHGHARPAQGLAPPPRAGPRSAAPRSGSGPGSHRRRRRRLPPPPPPGRRWDPGPDERSCGAAARRVDPRLCRTPSTSPTPRASATTPETIPNVPSASPRSKRRSTERDWLGYERRQAAPATREALVAVHAGEYVDTVRSMSERGGGVLDAETVVGPGVVRGRCERSRRGLRAWPRRCSPARPRGLLRDPAARPPRPPRHDVGLLPLQQRRRRGSPRARRARGRAASSSSTGTSTTATGRTTSSARRTRCCSPASTSPGSSPEPGRCTTRARAPGGLLDQPARAEGTRERTPGCRCSSTS